MFWRKIKGEQQMEFFILNINSFLGNYSLINDTRANRKKLKKIQQKCESNINSIIKYFNIIEELELEEMYLVLKDKNYDIWDKYFFHCILLSTTEVLIEKDEFNKDKAISRSISMYSRELKELMKKQGGAELIRLKLDLIIAKIEFNLIIVSQMFSDTKKYFR